ncbi:MAG: FAD binding domain-containing protein [Planctomycetota bacterium]
MRDTIDFLINGESASARGDDAWLMLSEFLRKRRGLAGTKVVCAEGDCGSCSVLVGRLEAGKLRYRSVASCIVQVLQLDATHVVTVEGLTPDGGLNAFQEAMVDQHGAQCGFCTPGIVVAMQELMDGGQPLDEHAVRRGLSGNLCRCTGYDAIFRAALKTDVSALPSVEARFPSVEIVDTLAAAAEEPTTIRAAEGTCFKPTTLDEATEFLGSQSDTDTEAVTVLSGGTDLGVVRNKGRFRPTSLMLTGGLAALREVRREGEVLHIGAGVPLSEFEEALASTIPEMTEFLGWFGSPPIRHAGTLAGNLCTASPIGDTAPALCVLGAEVELTSTRGPRMVTVEAFQTGYRTTDRRPDELVTAIRVPLLPPDYHLRLYKVSRRKDLDISTVSGAFRFAVRDGLVVDMRIVLGGVGATVIRMIEVEDRLRGQPATLERFEQAGQLASESVTPMTDVRGSARYRQTLVRNLFLKLWHEIDAGRFAVETSSNPAGGD